VTRSSVVALIAGGLWWVTMGASGQDTAARAERAQKRLPDATGRIQNRTDTMQRIQDLQLDPDLNDQLHDRDPDQDLEAEKDKDHDRNEDPD